MSFSNILGQEPAVALFKRALKEQKLAHAYLLVGPDGVGKRSLAKEVAKALNCKAEVHADQWPCDLCRECRLIQSNQYPDVILASPENKVLKIDVIRQLQQIVNLKPFESRWRVVIVEEIDQLTPEAAHAFLKTLEEPPLGMFFFLTTHYRERVFSTIQSRCQIVTLKSIPKEILQQKELPLAIVGLANGSFGRAFYWMDPEVSARRKEILERILNKQWSSTSETKEQTKSEERILLEEKIFLLQTALRDLWIWRKTKEESLLIHQDYKTKIKEVSSQLKDSDLKNSILRLDGLVESLNQNASLKLVGAVLDLEVSHLMKT